MYKRNKVPATTIERNTSYQGERIEQKIHRIVHNNEPITDGAPLIYTERKDGVQPQYDIRTDRFEIAVDAMDYVTRSQQAKREERVKGFTEKLDKSNNKTGGQSTEGTEGPKQS